ncbi:conserved hypothetical protein [Ricinus communis]|uniref:Uncharacterized protein n=1 Tax=Ricinus communis TaxID=3988 RepID=B9RRV7_RICCO|nr:conserved hypothetical protein [Ricinus communis]
MAALLKASLIAVMALLLALLSAHAAAPESAPAPAPTSAAGAILPSFGSAFVAGVVALFFETEFIWVLVAHYDLLIDRELS